MEGRLVEEFHVVLKIFIEKFCFKFIKQQLRKISSMLSIV